MRLAKECFESEAPEVALCLRFDHSFLMIDPRALHLEPPAPPTPQNSEQCQQNGCKRCVKTRRMAQRSSNRFDFSFELFTLMVTFSSSGVRAYLVAVVVLRSWSKLLAFGQPIKR